MNDKELADLWHSQREGRLIVNEDKVIQAIRDEHRREERRFFWLNVREIAAAVFLFFVFGGFGIVAKTARWALFAAALLCLGIGLFLFCSTIRQRVKESTFGDSVKEQLQKAVSQMQHREQLFRNILWWYMLPGVLGWGVVLFGITYEVVFELIDELGAVGDMTTVALVFFWGFAAFVLIYAVACFAFFAWVYRANRRAAATRYLPRLEQLKAMLLDLESGEEQAATG
jgi:hypothetical protein